MYCGECGAKNKEGAKICEKCGKSLGFDVKDFVKETASSLKEKFEKISEKDGKTYFSAKKYLSYAAFFQVWVWIIYAGFIIGGLGAGVMICGVSELNLIEGLIVIALILGGCLLTAWIVTLFLKIKIQDMRWKVDLHSSIMNNK